MAAGSGPFQTRQGGRSGQVRPLPAPNRLGGPAGLLPSKDALDYVHQLTQTTLLLVGLAVFLLLYRRHPGTAARRLVSRVT